MKSIQEAARLAMDIQDACNLCGVAQVYAQVMALLADLYDTEKANKHVVSVLFLDKMMQLAGCPGVKEFMAAYDECERLAADYDEQYAKEEHDRGTEE